MLWIAIRHGFGGWPEGARYSGADLECAVGCRSKKRAFCQRLGARLQRRPAKRRLQGHQPKRRRALLLRRKFRCIEASVPQLALDSLQLAKAPALLSHGLPPGPDRDLDASYNPAKPTLALPFVRPLRQQSQENSVMLPNFSERLSDGPECNDLHDVCCLKLNTQRFSCFRLGLLTPS